MRSAQIAACYFGLLRTDYSPKPAFSALASAYRGLETAERSSATARSASKRTGKPRVNRMVVPGSQRCHKLAGTDTLQKAQARR